MKDLKQEYLTKIWCGMCNFYGAISGKETCSKCPFKDDPEMCYDSAGEWDYNKFEKFITGLKLENENG